MTAIGASRNMLIPWYLIGAYAYYVLDTPVLSDATFDEICVMLDEEWDDLEHMHKGWVDRDDLSAGTRLSTLYPSMARGAACGLAGVPDNGPLGLLGALARCEGEMENLCRALK
jgi:hypothetical protein